MTKVELINKLGDITIQLIRLNNGKDIGTEHIQADDLLIEALTLFAEKDGLEVAVRSLVGSYDSIQKWYS